MSQSLIEQFRAEDAANGYTPGQNVRPALEVAASTNADQQARSMQLAEELGLSREVVSEQREWAEQEATARRIERNPMFARWAELSETNAAFARDDTEKMGDVFDILHEAELSAHGESGAQVKANIVRGVLQYNARHGDKDAQVRLQREAGLTEEEIRNGTISQTPMPGTMAQLGESYLEGWQGVAKNAAGFMAMLGENMGTNIQTGEKTGWAPLWDAVAKSARDALEYADTAHSAPLNAQGFANDFVRNLPQVAATIALSAAGSPAVGTAFVGSQIAGGTYADLTQKHEVRMPTAAELEEGARMLARAAAQGWQGAVNNARMAAHEAGGEGGALYEGEEPDELAMASARARMIAAAILNTEQAVPAGTAALAALGNAAVQAPLEMVGFGKLFDVFKATGAGNLVRRIVESAATEFVTETMQQHPDEFARIWGKGTAKGEGWQDVWKQYTGQFWDITKEGMYAGALSAPFGLLGGIGKAATDVRMAQEAVDWAQAHVAFHAKVEETKAKKVAPRLVQQALEEGGMRDIAHVDGEALYQLVQEDPLVLQQLGLEEKAVQQAAEAGQTITLPMSKVHAQMQQEQLAKFMAISRREPDSWTAREAEVLPETLKQTAERAAEKVAADTEAARQAEIEIRRIREEIVQAASSVPTLKAKMQADGMSPEAYADNHLEIIVRLAKSLADESGSSIADILRDQTYEGLDYDASGKLVPVSRLRDKERMEEERARAEADRPFWELVWGRVDPESLKTDYAETYKELRKSKRGLFMPAGRGGVPLDQIADELNERGIFTGSADDLLELLKTKERPRRGYYQEGELTEQEEKAEAAQRVQAWLSEENLAWAQGKNKDEIVARFGDELETVALLPEAYLDYFAGKSADNKVYSGKGYFIDHAVNHHPDIAPEEYGNLQAILDAPDEVLRDTRGKENDGVRDGLIFIKKIDKTYGIAVTMEAEQGMIVMHKSFFKTRKGAFKKLERLPIAPVGSTSSTIQSDGGTVPGGSLSALGAENSIAQAGEEVNSLEQRAFHGSPHRFMKFMLDHIGSGEGAQAHGYGLYFAQNRETAEGYRERLTRENRKFTVGKEHFQRNAAGQFLQADGAVAPEYVQAALRFIDGASSVQEGLANMAEFLKQMKKLPDGMFSPEVMQSVQEGKKWLTKKQISIETPEGQVYELDIPENDVLLDEQATFADQPEFVQAGVLAAFAKLTDEQVARVKQELKAELRLEAPDLDVLEVELKKDELKALARALSFVSKNKERPAHNSPFTGGQVYDASMRRLEAIYSSEEMQALQADDTAAQEEIAKIENQIADLERILTEDKERREASREQRRVSIDTSSILEALPGMKGEDIYSKLAVAYGGSKLASAALNDMGVKGITYDGQQDGRCFVIFDDQAIDMLDTFYQFIGEEGAARLDEAEEASTRMDNLDVARQMEEAGKDAAAIKLATGWERGADGKWRYEIDDSQVQVFPDGDRTWRQTDPAYTRFYELNDAYGTRELTPEEEAEYDELEQRYDAFNDVRKHFRQALEAGKLKLKDILGADDVFSAYPDIAELPVRFDELSGTALGAYTGEAILLNDRLIGRVNTAAQLKPILLHEVQHAIQDKEGFARGGSAANMWIGEARQHTARLYKEKLKPLSLEEYARQAWRTDEITDEVRADYQDYLKMATSRQADRAAQEGAAREAYRRLAGEAEARNTASRMGMTYEERLASLASQTEDVARKDQIFLQNALGRAMAMGEGARKGVIRGETVPAEKSGGMGDVVRLFYHADLSTLLHESSHVFFLQMARLVNSGKASERMKADYQTLCQWAGSTDGHLNTVQHERLARAMELYLREGKAPSKKLESAFARFRRWLTDIYKTVAGNPYFNQDGKQVELNPDVRRVFSRILATQEEVEAQAADDAMGGDWSTRLDRLGMTGAQRIAISGLIQDAKNHAEDELHRLREADKRDRMAKWRKECAQQIEGERVYQARTALRSRKGYGLDMRALANVVGNERALEFFKRLPGIKREGASPWAFAADFGYDSVEEFVNEVMAAPTKAERMAELMAAKEQEYDRQFRSDTLLAAEETAKVQEMLHEHLIKMTGSKERGVPLEEMRRAARDIMATLPIEEATSVGKFRYQAKRLMQAQHEAFMRRDFGKALDITFKLRLNLELTVQAQQNKKEFDALTKDMVRFTGSKEPNPVVRYAVARLAMKYGMLAPTKMIMRTEGDKDLKVVQGWIEAANAQGYPVEFDAELWTAQLPTWRQMNSATFRRLYAQLVSMMTVERQMRHVDVQGKRMALDQYSQTLGQHMLDNDPNRQNLGFADDKSLVQATKEFLDPLSTVNARLKMYDNFKPLGMAWRSIMEPINKAEAKQIQFFRKYGPMLQNLIKAHYDDKRLVTMKDRQQIPGLKEAVSHEMCIMVGLNMGNAGNRLRLMNGFKNTDTMQDYGEAEVNAMLEQLDENDWRFIQEVWDFFEQFKKESFDMEERLIGVRPLEVEPTPVRTKYGTLRGGYFPIAYDPRRGAKAANQQVGGGKNVMMPSVFHGMMKDRGDQGLGTPLDLRFSVITDKLAETGHNLAYREPVIEVAKLLRSHAVSRAIAATEGPVVELKFWKWLSALAGEKPTRNSLDKIASWATSRMAIYSMGFKATTMIAQATGLLATSTQIGWKWTGRGVRDTFNGGNLEKVKEMWQDVCARSPMMQDRMKSFDRDVYTMSHRLFETGHKNPALNLLKKTESWLTEHAFTATGFIQLWMVDIPTWRGAFAKGMEELNMTEEEAALYADDMVVTAQGSGATKDLSDIMREKGFMRVMTMFYSYFSAMYNMFMLQASKTLRHPKEEWPYLASMAFVLWFVEPAVTGLLTGRGPDDDEEWYEWALMNGVKQPFQMIPVLRDLSGAYFNHIEGKFGSDYRFTPAADVIGAFEKTLEHGADLFTGEDYEDRKKAAKRLARDIGMISGTPFLSSQAITTIGNMWDWLDGTEEFALRDLFFTRKK